MKKAVVGLTGLSRSFHSSAISGASALSELSKRMPDVGGLFSWFRSSEANFPPLTEGFPHQRVERTPLPKALPPAQVTTLPNGMRIVTQDHPGPMAAINVTVQCGSVYEDADSQTLGATHTLQHLAFTETHHRSHLRTVRELETLGANAQAMAAREFLTYEIEVPKALFAEAAEVVLDSAINPAINIPTLTRARTRCKADLARASRVDAFIDENVHARAFAGALATPLFGSTVDPEVGAEALAAFHAMTHSGSGMVVSATGVPHEAFISLAGAMGAEVPPVPRRPAPASVYQGGMACLGEGEGQSVALLAFEGRGGVSDMRADVARHVLAKLMGGGGFFSTGGPGKGMHSRLYTRVLCHDSRVSDCSFFHESYATTSLVGIRVTGDMGTGALLDIASREMLAAASGLTQDEVERAKASMEGNLGIVLESASNAADDLAKTVAIYGRRVEVKEFVDIIRSLTAADLQKEVAALVKTPPTVVAVGPGAPTYDAVARKFK